MLALKMLNSNATLNEFTELNSIKFTPGSQVKLVVRVFQPERNDALRFVLDPLATVTLTLDNTDGTELNLPMVAFPSDRSIWSTTITAAQSALLAGGNVRFALNLDGALDLQLGYIDNALQRINIGGC